MQEKRKALGRGLEQLFSDEGINTFEDIENDIVDNARANNSIVELDLNELRPNPYQPRKKFDEEALNELETIPAIIEEFSDEEMMQISLLENLQREDLTAIEEAKAYKSIIDASNITQDELARRVGKSRSHITNMLGLLKLPTNVQDLVLYNKISMGHARVLSKLENIDKINELAELTMRQDLSVRELEEVSSSSDIKRVSPVVRKPKDSKYDNLERKLKEKFGTKVKISDKKITISFENVQDLNRILEIMNFDIDE